MAYADIDFRRVSLPVARKKATVAIASGGTSGSGTVNMNGMIRKIYFVTPSLDSAGNTAELVMQDEDANPVLSSGEKAHNSKHGLTGSASKDIPVAGTLTIKVEASAPQTAARSFNIYMYYE